MSQCLVFGGNGCLGYEFITLLGNDCYATNRDVTLTLVNRDKSWDWKKKELLPYKLRNITCDRDKPLSECKELVDFVSNTDHFSTVVDFSGYKPFAVQEAIDLLQNKVGLYIYISTDSVYEVCDVPEGNDLILETKSLRPSSKSLRERLKMKDKYGNKKLECEEALQRQAADGGFPYIALRLPDVIGPRDSTDRWLVYHFWCKLSHDKSIPIQIPRNLESQIISLVYSRDVAKIITDIIAMENRHGIENEAFNLGFVDADKLTVKGLVQEMLDALEMTDVRVCCGSGKEPHVFPSVEKGPIDVSKAKSLLKWRPTPFQEAVKAIVLFYEEALKSKNFQQELWDGAKSFLEDLEDLYDEDVRKMMKDKLRLWIYGKN